METLEREEIKIEEFGMNDRIEKIAEIVDKLKQVVSEIDKIESRIIAIKYLEGSNNLDKEELKKLRQEYEMLTNQKGKLEKLKNELENKLLEILENDRIYIVYNENKVDLRPAIVIPLYLDEYFWIDISPTLAITIRYSKVRK